MYRFEITQKDAGQRLDKFLGRMLPEAGSGFLHKMLRKKNITLNEKKADGAERLTAGDSVMIFFSEETLLKFMGRQTLPGNSAEEQTDGTSSVGTMLFGVDRAAVRQEYLAAYAKLQKIAVLYENAHVLLADKPAGVLSQKAEQKDLSLNEWLIGYLLSSGALKEEELTYFKPSVCNRLDRNTSGIVLCAKSLQGARMLGDILRDRTLHKYYRTYVKGTVAGGSYIEGYLRKDETRNRVYIEPVDACAVSAAPESLRHSYIKTGYQPIRTEGDKTLLEVELITGKSHQIRAHLAGIGHPILGDYKYGDKEWNDAYRSRFQVRAQLLHAYRVVFPQLEEPFADLSGREVVAELPEIFARVAGAGNGHWSVLKSEPPCD